jgi:hypothetical protein
MPNMKNVTTIDPNKDISKTRVEIESKEGRKTA